MAQAMTIGPKIGYFVKQSQIEKGYVDENVTYKSNESAVGMHYINQSCIFL